MLKLHRAWLICAGATLLMFISTGMVVNTLTVYLPYILTEYGLSNGEGSLINTIRCLSSLGSMFFVEAYYRKLGLRRGTALAMALCVLSYVLYGLARSFPGFCLGAVVGGIGCSFGGIVAATVAIDTWFSGSRGTAMGLCTAGSGLAMVILPPVLTKILEAAGVSAAFLSEAAMMAALSVLILLIFRKETPAAAGLTPYGVQEQIQTQAAAKKGLSHGYFLALLLAMAFVGSVGGPGFNHLPVLYSSQGYDSMTVALGMSLIGFVLVVGKCLFGVITDRIGAYRTNFLFLGLLVLGFIFCCAASGKAWTLYAAQFCLGVGMCVCTVGLPVWAGDLTDPAQHARTVQRFQTAYSIGALLFSPVPGFVADLWGSYVPSYVLFTVQAAVILLILQLAYSQSEIRPKIEGVSPKSY